MTLTFFWHIIRINNKPSNSLGYFSNWAVYITFVYLVFAIQSNWFGDDSINNKALANLFGDLAIGINTITFSVSWTYIHPMLWLQLGWDTFDKVMS